MLFSSRIIISTYHASLELKDGSGGSAVDNMLDYQSRVLRSSLRFSGLSDETFNQVVVSVWPNSCCDV